MLTTRLRPAALALSLAAAGCSSGGGDVNVTIWGEEYIEQNIPEAEFEDGWTATFSTFAVSISGIRLIGSDGEVGALPATTVFDLTKPGPHAVGVMSDIDTTAHDDFGYAIVPADANASGHSSVDAADLQTMQDEGYSVFVRGSMTKGADTKTFQWAFSHSTRYDACVDVSSGQDVSGLVVVDSGTEAQLTIHGDHFFYDDLLSTGANLRGDIIASADADMDGEVTQAELAAVPLANIPPEQGPYGVGASDVNDLGAYMQAATQTLGHFNGEGHCTVKP